MTMKLPGIQVRGGHGFRLDFGAFLTAKRGATFSATLVGQAQAEFVNLHDFSYSFFTKHVITSVVKLPIKRAVMTIADEADDVLQRIESTFD